MISEIWVLIYVKLLSVLFYNYKMLNTFPLCQVDTSTGEADEDGVEDEYQLEEFEVVAADYMLRAPCLQTSGMPGKILHAACQMAPYSIYTYVGP